MNVGIIGNPRYPDLRGLLDHIAELASVRGMSLFAEEGLTAIWQREMPSLDDADLDVLITLGGDGTLLRGARAIQGRQIPILGINLGRVGFLTTSTGEALDPALDALVAGAYQVDDRMALSAQISGTDGTTHTRQFALNDVAIHKSGVARVVRLSVEIEGEEVGPYSADGIVVSSPTGSTAYSLSAGGPIMVPGVEGMIVTPICAHTLAVRPLVVPARFSITVTPIPPWADDLLVSYDGQVGTTLTGGDRVTVCRASSVVRLIRIGPEGFLTRMRKKLHWGDLSGRERRT